MQKYYSNVKPNYGFMENVFEAVAKETFNEIDREFSLGVPEFIKFTEQTIKEQASSWIINDKEALAYTDVLTEFEIPKDFYLNLRVNGKTRRYYFDGRVDRVDLNSSSVNSIIFFPLLFLILPQFARLLLHALSNVWKMAFELAP